jgi:hypothetical protein
MSLPISSLASHLFDRSKEAVRHFVAELRERHHSDQRMAEARATLATNNNVRAKEQATIRAHLDKTKPRRARQRFDAAEEAQRVVVSPTPAVAKVLGKKRAPTAERKPLTEINT